MSDITEAEGVSDKLEGQTPVHLLAHPDDYGEGDECTIKNSMPFTLKAPGNTKKQIDFEESSSVSSLSNDLSPSFDQLQERYVSDNDWMVTKIVSKEMDFSLKYIILTMTRILMIATLYLVLVFLGQSRVTCHKIVLLIKT